MRKNITLPAALLFWLSMTCLTLTGQSKVNVRDMGELKVEEAQQKAEMQEARLKAEAQEARFKAEAQKAQLKTEALEARLQAEAQKARLKAEAQEARQKEKARDKGATDAFMKLSSANTTGMQLRSDGTTTYASTVRYSPTGDKQSKQVYTYTKGRLTLSELAYRNGDDWENFSKYEYAYDDNGNQTLHAAYYGVGSTWVNSWKYEYAYNDYGTRILEEYYSGINDEWVLSRKYEWDNWGYILEEYYTDGAPSSKYVYAHDDYGNTTLYEYYYGEGNEWAPVGKYVYAYDTFGNQTLFVNYKGEGNEWMPVEKYERAYDANGNQTLYEYYTGVDNEWMPIEKYERAYDADANGYPRTLLNASYKGEGNEWVPVEKYVYGYDAMYQTLREYYTGVDNEWVKSYKYAYAYDDYGNQTLYERYIGVDNEWVGQYKTTSVYDSGILIANANYSWIDNDWVISSEGAYDYGEQTVDRNKVYAVTRTDTYYDYDGITIISTYKGVGINIPSHGIFLYSLHSGNYEYVFTSDNDGNLTKVDVYSVTEENNEEVKTLIENYVIGYENNLPVSIAYNEGSVLRTKFIRQYDANGNMTLNEWYRWNYEKNLLVTNDKQVYDYDAKGRQTLYESYYGNESGDGWVYGNKYVYAFDDAGRQTLYEYYQGNENGDGWISINSKYVYAYNDFGDQILYEYYNNSNGNGDNWIYVYKNVLAFNDDGRRTLYESYNGNENGDGWVCYEKAIYGYNDDGREILREYYSGNESGDEWIPDRKWEYAYDTIGRETLYAYYLWDADAAEWVIESKRVNAYNANGQNTLYETFNRYNGELRGDKYEYEYDANGNEASYTYYYWDIANEAWRDGTRTTYYEKGKNGSTIVASHYRWENEQWTINGYTLYYPDAEQVAPIELKDTSIEVTESSAINYSFNLESLLPNISYATFGELTYSIGTVTNYDNILGTINYTEGTTLTLPIYGAGAGTASIPVTIESANLGRFLAIIRITTFGTPSVSVNGVGLNAAEVALGINETFQLMATVYPTGADNQGVSWQTSDPAIATVIDGVVTAIAPGTATITVITDDGGYTATCTVVVTDNSVGAGKVSQETAVFFYESTLTVDSPASETIAVYDFNGRLLFSGKKPQGKTVFTVGNPAGGKLVIVKGSSGWIKKMAR